MEEGATMHALPLSTSAGGALGLALLIKQQNRPAHGCG
jgi:hypothetical protein